MITAAEIKNMSVLEYMTFRESLLVYLPVLVREPGTNSYSYYRYRYINYEDLADLSNILESVNSPESTVYIDLGYL